MPPSVNGRGTDDRRTLDAIGVLAFVFAGVAVVSAFADSITAGLAALAVAGLAFACWWWERGSRDPRAGCGLVVAAFALMLVPGSGPWGVVMLFFAVALVGRDAGLVPALAVAVGVGVVVAISIWVSFDASLASIATQSIGTIAMLSVAGAFGGMIHDLEQARADSAARAHELRVANERLRESITTERELVLAQERARSARELHDGLGHRLTLVSMSLQFAQRVRDRDPQRAWAEIEQAAATNHEALDLMRLWARALNPPRADVAAGGAATFEAIADAFRGTGLEVEIRHHGPQDALPGPVTVFATRLIQEGLTNVLRHAQASRVVVDIAQSASQVRLSLTDDGTAAVGSPEGFGLRSLRDRAVALGGRLTSGPAAGAGWEIAAVLPLAAGAPG